MTIANVSLTNTFDEWRTRTNQLIVFSNDIESINVRSVSDRTNTAYVSTNTAYQFANLAYEQANTARNQGNTAFIQANTAYTVANTYHVSLQTKANLAFSQANDAYTQANTALITAQNAVTDYSPAFIQANTARTGANTVGGYANAAFAQANTARTGANTVGDYANAAFLQANTARTGANTVGSYANAAFLQANTARDGANTVGGYSNSAFAQANTARDGANTVGGYANAAFAKANTIGTLGTQSSGSVTITGGSITGLSTLTASSFAVSSDTNNRFIAGDIIIRGSSPTVRFRDTDGSTAMLHNNSSLFYILRGAADSEGWSQINGQWPVTVNLNNNDMTIGGSLYVVGDIAAFYSDARLKTDIVPIKDALFKVKQINGITYRNNELAASFGFEADKTHVGVLAHEVEAVLPEVVTLAAFDKDEKTGESRSGENYVTVKYDKIVPLLIEAIKELSNQVETLTQQVQELKK